MCSFLVNLFSNKESTVTKKRYNSLISFYAFILAAVSLLFTFAAYLDFAMQHWVVLAIAVLFIGTVIWFVINNPKILESEEHKERKLMIEQGMLDTKNNDVLNVISETRPATKYPAAPYTASEDKGDVE